MFSFLQENIVHHCRTYPSRPRDLRCHFISKYFDLPNSDPLGLHQAKLDDLYWMSKVTSLCLNNLHLTSLPDLSNMICLRWASFDHNCLTSIRVGNHELKKISYCSISFRLLFLVLFTGS
jgi:hypothetical protein